MLLEKYFEKHPDDAEKVVISIKGGLNYNTGTIDGSPENTRRTLDDSIAQLKGRKKIDLFEFGRVDKKVPLSMTLGIIEKEYVKTGKIGGVSLSEVTADVIQEAVKHTKILGVEVELSMQVGPTVPISGSYMTDYIVGSPRIRWKTVLRPHALNMGFLSLHTHQLGGAC